MASCETLEEQDPSDPTTQQPLLSKNTIIQQQEEHNNPQIEPPLHSETLIDDDEEQNSTNPNNSIIQQSDKDYDDEEEEDDDNENDDQKPQRMTSPRTTTYYQKRGSKKKSKKKGKNPKNIKKVQILTDSLKPVPFNNKKLVLVNYEGVLKKLGLYEFTQIEFDPEIQTGLIAQLIVNYDPKKRSSVVNDYRINVNRADLARALKLPLVKQQVNKQQPNQVDLDSDVYSDDDIGFLENFVMNFILLGEESWDFPTEIVNWTRCIRDGHPEKLDSASLIWYKVEKELTQGDKLVYCYYASHLQYLIKSQREKLFNNPDVNSNPQQEQEQEQEQPPIYENVDLTLGKKDVEEIIDEEVVKEDDQEMVDAQEDFKVVESRKMLQEPGLHIDLPLEEVGPDVEEIIEEEVVKEDDREMVDAQEDFEVMEEVNVGSKKILQGPSLHIDPPVEVVPDVEEIVEEEVVKEDDGQEDFKVVEEVGPDAEENGNWQFGGNKMLGGDHYLQRCQNSDLNNNFKETEIEEDENIEQVDEEDEEEEEDVDEGFDMEANDDSLEDRDGLTGNYLQGVETSHAPFNSHHGISSMDLFGTRDASFMSHDVGPSFFNNGGKRAMEPEEDIHHLDANNNKRLKTDIWNQKPNDFGFCLEQMQQWMEKAKIIHESKEQAFSNSQYDQQVTINEMQERNNFLEMVIKSRDEELQSKNNDIFRLERELYLMGDLVKGFRGALNDTRVKFADYRKRYALKEEPLYRDAGPGGLVLSVREIEKRRLKQEEDKAKFVSMAKSVEDEFLYVFEKHQADVLMMADKLGSVENELKRVKELYTKRKETQTGRVGQELLVNPEENQKSTDKCELNSEPEENQKSDDGNQKSDDEIMENDASVESVSIEADESKEKEGDDV